MSPELQAVLNDALVVLIPVLTAIITAWFAGWKNRKDTNAAFKKIRAHEEYMGIETRVDKGVVHVASRPGAHKASSANPEPLRKEGG